MKAAFLAAAVQTALAANCFSDNLMQFTYHMPDFTAQYTAVGEYWLAKDTTCDWLANQNTKVTWYSSDVNAQFQMYYDQGNFDCRAEYNVNDYPMGFDVVLGSDNDNACLVKYIITNDNTVHDLRVQYFMEYGPMENTAKFIAAAVATTAAAMTYLV